MTTTRTETPLPETTTRTETPLPETLNSDVSHLFCHDCYPVWTDPTFRLPAMMTALCGAVVLSATLPESDYPRQRHGPECAACEKRNTVCQKGHRE